MQPHTCVDVLRDSTIRHYMQFTIADNLCTNSTNKNKPPSVVSLQLEEWNFREDPVRSRGSVREPSGCGCLWPLFKIVAPI